MSSLQPGMSLQLADNTSLNMHEASTKIPRLEISSRASSRHGSISDRDDTPGRCQRPRRDSTGRASSLPKSPVSKANSSIPLPVKATGSKIQKVPSMCSSVMSGRTGRSSTSTIRVGNANLAANKHSLEMQFMNKKKRLSLLRRELTEKQRPVVELYQNLTQIKKKLEELGKVVYLEEIKVLTYDEKIDSIEPGGDFREQPEFAAEMLAGMKTTTEDIPKTLMDICQNLLCRRNVIVDLLDGLMKSEVTVDTLNDQVDALKAEGVQLQNNLDAVIDEHHRQIKEIVQNWSRLLQNKTNVYTNAKVEELQEKLRVQEKMTEDAKATIGDMQRRLEDRKVSHDRSVADMNGVIVALREQVQKLEQDIEYERKTVAEYKTRNHANAQSTKNLRARITELESGKRAAEATTQESARKIKLIQEQSKNREAQWMKEREELLKSLKHQENLLQKANTEKQSFETRIDEVRDENKGVELELQAKIESLMDEIEETKAMVRREQEEKEAIQKKFDTLEEFMKGGGEGRNNIGKITTQIPWGTSTNSVFLGRSEKPTKLTLDELPPQPVLEPNPEAYVSDAIGACRKQLSELETEKLAMQSKEATMDAAMNEEAERRRAATAAEQEELINSYQKALEEWRDKYVTNSHEMTTLKSEVCTVRSRLDELRKPGTWRTEEELGQLLDEHKKKLDGLAFRTYQREEAIAHCEAIQERLNKQINELENFVRQRENLAGVLKASRDELILEKESLSKYSNEMRRTLDELTKENKYKDKLIKQFQHKLYQRDRLLHQVESEIRDMETKASGSNASRLLCQERAEVEPPPVDSRYAQPGTMQRNDYYSDCRKSKTSHQRCGLSDDMRRSLMGASLKQMDLMKARLLYLTKINLAAVASREDVMFERAPREVCRTGSVPSIQKALDLSVKRYSLLQKQAYESYEDITKLFQLVLSTQSLNHK